MTEALELIRDIANTTAEDFDNSRDKGHFERIQDWATRAEEAQQDDNEDEVAEFLETVVTGAETHRRVGYETITFHNSLIESAETFVEENEPLFESASLSM